MTSIAKKILLAVASILAYGITVSAADGISGLSTEYRTDPVGIEVAKPRFGWQMTSGRNGASQKAYRIIVKDSGDSLVWDSGKMESGISVAVPYEGGPLAANERYSWNVTVWNEKGRALKSADAHFSTGLMGEGWDGAKWIGSRQAHFSRYRSYFDLSYSFKGKESEFIVDRKSDDTFISIAVRAGRLVVSHSLDGIVSEDASVAVRNLGSEYNRVWLAFRSERYRRGTVLTVRLNGSTLVNKLKVGFDNSRSVGKGWARLYDIGYPEGQAEFSDIIIEDGIRGTMLYRAAGPFKASEGAKYWSPADKVGAPMLRTDIELVGTPVSATLYSTARGTCNFWINGTRADDGWFCPGSTEYDLSFAYQATDITALLHKGINGVGAILGSGWYTDALGYHSSWQDQWGIDKSVMAKIHVRYDDGSSQVFITDGSWKVYDGGPITNDSLLNGEDYDARREVDGWSRASFDDVAWEYADLKAAPGSKVLIKPYVGEPIKCAATLSAKAVTEPRSKVFVYDMGQNMVGVPSIRLHGKAGQRITIKYGEMIFPDTPPEEPIAPMTTQDYIDNRGLVYNENYRSALSEDHYICKGSPEGETFSPLLTFHGYRYVQIEGLDEALPPSDVKGLVLNSIGFATSSFVTSDNIINKLFSNIQWGQSGNFLSVPTDCPQRDERFGWTGDAQIFARSATYNMNVDQFFSRWLETLRETQMSDGCYYEYAPHPKGAPTKSLGWNDAGIIIPWQLYQQYGDKRIVEQSWDSMVRYFNYLESRALSNLQPGGGYGDWLAVELTISPLTNTAYYAYDAILMSKMAAAIGKAGQAAYYKERYEVIKKAFNKEFVDENGCTKESRNIPEYSEKIASGHTVRRGTGTQTSYVVPMMFGLFDEKNQPLAEKHLMEEIRKTGYTLTTGFIGTPYLCTVLTSIGQDEAAWKLFEQTAYPSWLYPVLQGATTIWERWNSYTVRNGFGKVSMNSFNHYSYGAIEEWMMTSVLGISRDEENPGYKHFYLTPHPGGTLSFAKGGFDSPYGRIEAGWTRTKLGWTYEVTIPANTTATLIAGGVRKELPSGKHRINLK